MIGGEIKYRPCIFEKVVSLGNPRKNGGIPPVQHGAGFMRKFSGSKVCYASSRTSEENPTRIPGASEAIFPHSTMHSRQAAAHSRQAASLYCSHSTAHNPQISAHSSQKRPACNSPRCTNAAVRRQRSAQWILNSSGLYSPLAFDDSEQATAHCSHKAAHLRHASMHILVNSSFMVLGN